MPKLLSPKLLIAATICAVGASCSSGTEPSSGILATYDLVSIDGVPLPGSCGNVCAIPRGWIVVFDGDTSSTNLKLFCNAMCMQRNEIDSATTGPVGSNTPRTEYFAVTQNDSTLVLQPDLIGALLDSAVVSGNAIAMRERTAVTGGIATHVRLYRRR